MLNHNQQTLVGEKKHSIGQFEIIIDNIFLALRVQIRKNPIVKITQNQIIIS